jgi:hypothetical protein
MSGKNYLGATVAVLTIIGTIVGTTVYLHNSFHTLSSSISSLEKKMDNSFAAMDKEMTAGFSKADKEIGIIKAVLLMKELMPPELATAKNLDRRK